VGRRVPAHTFCVSALPRVAASVMSCQVSDEFGVGVVEEARPESLVGVAGCFDGARHGVVVGGLCGRWRVLVAASEWCASVRSVAGARFGCVRSAWQGAGAPSAFTWSRRGRWLCFVRFAGRLK